VSFTTWETASPVREEKKQNAKTDEIRFQQDTLEGGGNSIAAF